ncbi:hypothetical protein TWF694_007859 [Orbilia ellipsospora]|uniref:GLEYA adhesin domain-containing protein n=1 Tax=Orbilia ellipsospora TaxID=2528407 RepID=A0AAV9XIZ2_9PEZI
MVVYKVIHLLIDRTEAFPPQTAIDDCRNAIWTHSTVADTTINIRSTKTFYTSITQFTTTTTTRQTNNVEFEEVTKTETAQITIGLQKTQTSTNTVTVETSVTKTATEASTVTLTSSITTTQFVTQITSESVTSFTEDTTTITDIDSTITLTSRFTVTDFTTQTATNTVTIRTSLTNTAVENLTTTIISIVTEFATQTNTNTVTAQVSTTNTITEQFTTTLTSSTSVTASTATKTSIETQSVTLTASQFTTITSLFTQTTVVTSSTTGTLSAVSGVAAKKRVKRQETAVPAYASACPNQSAYESACTCMGVTTGGTKFFHIPSIFQTFVVNTTLTVTQMYTQHIEQIIHKNIKETKTKDIMVTDTITTVISAFATQLATDIVTIDVDTTTTVTKATTVTENIGATVTTVYTLTFEVIDLLQDSTVVTTVTQTTASETSRTTVTELTTQMITTTSTVNLSTTTTVLATSTINSDTISTEIATQTVTSTITISTDVTLSTTQSFSTTVTSSLTVTETDTQEVTDTVTTSQSTIIVVNATTTSTSIVPLFTDFAIQLTSDVANGPYAGMYMYYYITTAEGDGWHIAWTSNATKAIKYQADMNGNVTGPSAAGAYNILFSVLTEDSPPGVHQFNQVYGIFTHGGWGPIDCWIDSAYIFQCQNGAAIYLNYDNATSNTRIGNDVRTLYNLGSTGPLVMQAVPYPPSAATPTIPPPAAKSVILQNVAQNSDPNYTYYENYIYSIQEGYYFTEPGPYPRHKFTANRTEAKVFLADPATGNLHDLQNRPFLFNNNDTGSSMYSLFPISTTNTIVGCTLQEDLSVTCVEGGYQYLGVYNQGAALGYFGIWNQAALAGKGWAVSLKAILL